MADASFTDRFWKAVAAAWPMVRGGSVPWTPLARPIAEARVALVTTCGVHRRSDPPFDLGDRRGDPSFRELPADVRPDDLMITHGHYDQADAERDLNVVFPLWRLHELAALGEIGAVAPRHFGFRGAIYAPARLIRASAPEVARQLSADRVDVVLLTPC